MNIHHHMSVFDTVNDAIQSLQRTKQDENNTNSSSQLIWIDMPCTLSLSDSSKLSYGNCMTPEDINQNLSNILQNTSTGDVVCVLTQGDLMEVRRLIAHKQKCRWLEASLKTGNSSAYLKSYYSNDNISNLSSLWTPNDEEDLIKAAAYSIAGSFFIKYIE